MAVFKFENIVKKNILMGDRGGVWSLEQENQILRTRTKEEIIS